MNKKQVLLNLGAGIGGVIVGFLIGSVIARPAAPATYTTGTPSNSSGALALAGVGASLLNNLINQPNNTTPSASSSAATPDGSSVNIVSNTIDPNAGLDTIF